MHGAAHSPHKTGCEPAAEWIAGNAQPDADLADARVESRIAFWHSSPVH